MLPLLHPWCCPWNNSLSRLSSFNPPASFHLFFPLPKKGGRRSVDWYVCGLWAQGRWGIQTLICHHLAPLQAHSLTQLRSSRTVEGRVATSKHFLHSCLSSARQLGPLTVTYGVRVRHEPFSLHRAVKLQLTLEKHFESLLSLSSTHNPSIHYDENCTNYPSPRDHPSSLITHIS